MLAKVEASVSKGCELGDMGKNLRRRSRGNECNMRSGDGTKEVRCERSARNDRLVQEGRHGSHTVHPVQSQPALTAQLVPLRAPRHG